MLNDKSILFFPTLPWNRNCGRTLMIMKERSSPPKRKINVSEKTHFSLRIVENIRFCLFFFIFTLLPLFCYISVVTIITFLDSLSLNAYGNIKYGLVQKFQLYCKRTYRELLSRRWTGTWGNCVLRFNPGPYT